MKEALYLIMFIAALIVIGELEISFHPFKVSMEGWRDLVAAVFMILTLFFFGSARYIEGYAKGAEEGVKSFVKILREKAKEYDETVIKSKEEKDGKEDWRRNHE